MSISKVDAALVGVADEHLELTLISDGKMQTFQLKNSTAVYILHSLQAIALLRLSASLPFSPALQQVSGAEREGDLPADDGTAVRPL